MAEAIIAEISIEDAIARLDRETQEDYDRAEAADDFNAAVRARLQMDINEVVKKLLRNGEFDVCLVDDELRFYRRSDDWVMNDVLEKGKLERDDAKVAE